MDPNDAVINPVKGKKSPDLGPLAVMVSNGSDLNLFHEQLEIKGTPVPLMMSRIWPGRDITLAGPVVGAPYAAMMLETIVAWGVQKVIYAGWCGSISTGLKTGDILLPTGAFADEGTSIGYGEKYRSLCRPSESLLQSLWEALVSDGRLQVREGSVWTTDAIYRETREKIEYFQSWNALAVEMELSALFTVAKFRQIEIASVQVVSDELSTLTWQPGFKNQRFKASRRAVVEVIRNYVSQHYETGD